MKLSRSGGCSITGTRGGGRFKVNDLHFDFTPGTSPTDPGTLKDITIDYLTGTSTEVGSIACPGVPRQSLPGPWWSAMFLGAHASERQVADVPFYRTKEWKVSEGKKLGTKEWDLSPGSGISEQGSFELVHTPE